MQWAFLFRALLLLSGFISTKGVEAPTMFHGNGSYNSFRRQVGFCKLQGFDTISRSTSRGPLVFTSGLVFIGVGMNRQEFKHNISNCGRCVRILSAEGIPRLYDELDGWEDTQSQSFPILAFVMDECKDEVCGEGYLDFDIYHPQQPVARGNPKNLVWEYTDCPVPAAEPTEFLFCFNNTCKEHDMENRTTRQVLEEANPFYWTVFLRNLARPVARVRVDPHGLPLLNREGWTWDWGPFDFFAPFSLVLDDARVFHFDFSRALGEFSAASYRGGLLVRALPTFSG